MNTTVRTVLILTFAATICLLFGLVLFGYWRELGVSPGDRLAYSKLYLEAFKVIVVSFFVALIGILIPARIREVRYNFEKMKESRIAYSEAKTGVSYLPVQLCSLDFAEAAGLVQRVHFQKHQAELYEELKEHVEHLSVSPRQWGNALYGRLVTFRAVLEHHAADWDALTRSERIKLLLDARLLDQKEKKETKDFPDNDIIG